MQCYPRPVGVVAACRHTKITMFTPSRFVAKREPRSVKSPAYCTHAARRDVKRRLEQLVARTRADQCAAGQQDLRALEPTVLRRHVQRRLPS